MAVGSVLVLATFCLGGCNRLESLEPLEPSLLSPSARQPEQPQPGQWPGYRGGTLQGVAGNATLPILFGPEVNVRWCVDLPGTGNSSPTVFGDRVFLTAQYPGNPPELVVICIDRVAGDVRWEQVVGIAAGKTHHKNGYATATVATDGERIYATFGPRGVFCFSVEGELLWNVPLDHLEHPWGHASTPVLAGNLVVQLADGARGSRLTALNCYTGQTVWSAERESSGAWTTPALVSVEANGAPRWELVVNGTGSTNGAPGYVIAYDPDTGDELWRVQGTTDIPCPTAIVGESLVVSTSGMNGPIIAIRPGLVADGARPRIAWRLPVGGPHVPTGVIANGLLYLVSDGGILRCFEAETGDELWKKRLRRTHNASLVVGDGKLFATSEQGDIHVFDMTGDHKLLAINRLQQRCLATPAIGRDELFVRTERRLYCFAEPLETASDNTAATSDVPAKIIPASTLHGGGE